MFQRTLLLGTFVVLAGCSGSQSYVIDNPTEKPLSIAIDGKTYDIAPHDSTGVSLKSGEHTMHGDVVGDIKFISYVRGRGGIINPTLGDYVIMRQSYVPDPANDRGYGGKPDSITLDGVEFQGLIEKHDDLFIDKNWSFGLDEDLPDSVTEHKSGNAVNTIRSKVFRGKDFIAYFEEHADAKGYFEANRPKDPTPAVRKLKPLTLPHIDDPAFEANTADLRALCVSYAKATDPAEQEKLQKDFNSKLTAYSQAISTQNMNASPEVNRQADSFMRAVMSVLGSTALVEP